MARSAKALELDHIPAHICIIMDGNHRWAKRRHLPGAAGHRAGAKMLRKVALSCAECGVNTLTLFAFSTENWQRPTGEVSVLMDLMRHVMQNDLDELDKRDVRLRVIGDRSKFAPDIQDQMAQCETKTQNNTALNLNVAVNFGGRWDIVNAAKAMAEKVASGELGIEDIDEAQFQEHMSLAGLPAPDLLIRTGGDQRISNFLLWDVAYTEFYFTDLFWPDFDDAALHAALEEYAQRTRRYGGREDG